MRICTIDSGAGFASIAEEWDDLLASSRQDNPFLTHDWLSAWWDCFGEGAELNILTCRDEGGRLAGALPLYSRPMGRFFGARVLRYIGDAGVGSVRLTAFALPAEERLVFDAFGEHLREKSADWDVMDLLVMHPDGAFFPAACTAPEGGRVLVDERWHAVPRVPLAADWDVYLSQLSTHMRGEVRRRRRKMEGAGAEVELVGEPEALQQAISDLVRIYEGRMRHTADRGFSVSVATRSFFEQSMRDMMSRGALRLRFLKSEGERLAFTWQFRHGDVMYNMMTAFDDVRGKQDVATALLGYGIEGAILEGCAVFDMLSGAQPYKFQWNATEVDWLSDVHVYRGTAGGSMRLRGDKTKALARRAAGGLPKPFGDSAVRFAKSLMRGPRG